MLPCFGVGWHSLLFGQDHNVIIRIDGQLGTFFGRNRANARDFFDTQLNVLRDLQPGWHRLTVVSSTVTASTQYWVDGALIAVGQFVLQDTIVSVGNRENRQAWGTVWNLRITKEPVSPLALGVNTTGQRIDNITLGAFGFSSLTTWSFNTGDSFSSGSFTLLPSGAVSSLLGQGSYTVEDGTKAALNLNGKLYTLVLLDPFTYVSTETASGKPGPRLVGRTPVHPSNVFIPKLANGPCNPCPPPPPPPQLLTPRGAPLIPS